jgi:hypothetical protein
MRLTLAPASKFADEVRGSNKKARPYLRGCDRVRAMANLNKPTGVSATNTRAGLTPTHPGKRTQLKLARSLSLRPPDRSRRGASDEHSPL